MGDASKHGFERTQGDDDYCTPPEVLELVRKLGRIDLDPCGNPYSMVEARHTFVIGPEHNPQTVSWGGGLAIDWRDYVEPGGLAFVNPPYGRALPLWSQKILVAERVVPVVSLVPARVETEWYRTILDGASSEHFFGKRISFWRRGKPATQARFPSAMLVAGIDHDLVAEVFQVAGRTVRVDLARYRNQESLEDTAMPKKKTTRKHKAKPSSRLQRKKPLAAKSARRRKTQPPLPHMPDYVHELEEPADDAEGPPEFPVVDTASRKYKPMLVRFRPHERALYEQLAAERKMTIASFIRHVLERFARGLELRQSEAKS